jgi:hypothetical protein
MCFSAEASFAGGVIISAIGIVTVTKVHKPSQILFACIPIFFGLQQFAEGIIWMTIPRPEYSHVLSVSTYLFLIMADVVWPSMIPLSILLMEQDRKRKKYLWALLVSGIVVSGYYSFNLLTYPVKPEIEGFHILYVSAFPKPLDMVAFFVYLISGIPPLFISSIKRTHLMGWLMLFSCAISAFFFTQYLTSVWCFFAALISGVIFWILRDSKRKFKFDALQLMKNKISQLVEK